MLNRELTLSYIIRNSSLEGPNWGFGGSGLCWTCPRSPAPISRGHARPTPVWPRELSAQELSEGAKVRSNTES